MKKLIVLLVMMFVCVGIVSAENTSDTQWNDPSIAALLNDEGIDIDHQHQYNEYEAPVGVGVDLILWQFNEDAKLLKNIKAETKYDFNNEQASAFLVVTLSLPDLLKK